MDPGAMARTQSMLAAQRRNDEEDGGGGGGSGVLGGQLFSTDVMASLEFISNTGVFEFLTAMLGIRGLPAASILKLISFEGIFNGLGLSTLKPPGLPTAGAIFGFKGGGQGH